MSLGVKRKRVCLNMSDKVQILKDIDCGIRKKHVAVKYGISPSSLSTIFKNRHQILAQSEEIESGRKRVKKCKFQDLEQSMLKWVKLAKEKNLPLSGRMIQEKAQEFSKNFGYKEFRASAGWLDKFKARHGIIQKTVSGSEFFLFAIFF